jgi:hypothetical protein
LHNFYTNHRAELGKSWIALNLLYGLLRVVLVKATVAKYGVNTAVFAAIEAVSSLGTGFGTVRLVDALVDRDRTLVRWWGAVVAAGFLAPDLYVLLAGDREMPLKVYVVVGVWIVAAATTSVASVVRRVRKRRITIAAE